MTAIPDRSLEVLRAIVNDYISSREPVGSKALVERHAFGVSAATIRNDMAILEDEELIVAPHTSSGRVPTDKGYRVFVDRLEQVKPLSPAERTAIESFLTESADLDETLGKTARLLAQLTQQAALVQYPSLGRASVRHIELIPVTETRVLLMLITDSGRIQQHVLELGQAMGEPFLAELRARLNADLAGKELTQVAARTADYEQRFEASLRPAVKRILQGLSEQIDANRQDKVVLAGAANLARREADFGGSIGPILDAIEEQVVLLRLISEMRDQQHGVSLRIGRENTIEELSNSTVLVSGYESQGSELAKLAVIGPTRMDYAGNIAAVSAVARYLSRALGH